MHFSHTILVHSAKSTNKKTQEGEGEEGEGERLQLFQ